MLRLMTELFTIHPVTDAASSQRAVDSALAQLAAGRSVIAPTESLYILLVPAQPGLEPDAENALHSRGYQAIDWVRADASDILSQTSRPTPAARRLAARYWPGPLQLRLEIGGRITLARVPSDETTRELLRRAPGPLRGYEATDSCAESALGCTPDGLARVLPQVRLGAVIDAGRARIQLPPAAVAATLDEFTILRPGILNASDLERTALRRILFVCSGNTCRSPMAAALLKRALSSRLDIPAERLAAAGFVVESAGAHAMNGSTASSGAQNAMRAIGIDLAPHRSRLLDATLYARQDYVFTMTRSLLTALSRALPPGPRLAHIDAAQRDVIDPFGGDDAEYEVCAAEITDRIEEIADRICADPDARGA